MKTIYKVGYYVIDEPTQVVYFDTYQQAAQFHDQKIQEEGIVMLGITEETTTQTT